MKRTTDHHRLLRDVLSEDAPAELESVVLEATLRHVRRRRQQRMVTRFAAPMTAALVALGIWTARRETVPVYQPLYAPVSTAALPARHVISTRPFGSIVSNADAPRVAMVETNPDGILRLLRDEELLALLGNGKAALVRTSSDTQQLIVLPSRPTSDR